MEVATEVKHRHPFPVYDGVLRCIALGFGTPDALEVEVAPLEGTPQAEVQRRVGGVGVLCEIDVLPDFVTHDETIHLVEIRWGDPLWPQHPSEGRDDLCHQRFQ
eukprot:CAMPEP_0117466222 /NCGR_PEP_ID=MMETSP0784-20121206/5032_1 /TAXON_ID=39447 /ORGANISM="" /LENGTH=103 /DNA_ID=CAMNT_0005260159 /DNA_START=120 /DNA_END=431 /DNA_ORIENTATION=+